MSVVFHTAIISYTSPFSLKKTPAMSFSISMSTPWRLILVLWVPIFSFCIVTDLVARMHRASALASSSDVNKMSHIALDLLDNTYTSMFMYLSASSITSLLTPTNFPVLT